MNPSRSLLIASILVAFAAQIAMAQTWSTGYFNSANGYGPNFSSLDGAPTNAPASEQWQTTDPLVGDVGATSQMQFMEGWTFGLSASGNKSVLFGGYAANGGVLPGITNPVIFRDFDHTFGTAATTFSVDFGIIANPTISFTNIDVFGFNLASASGTNLASFQFNSVGALPGFLKIEWLQNGTNVATNGTTFNGFQIQYGALYRLTATLTNNTIDMIVAGLTADNGGPGIGITNYTAGPAALVVNGGQLSGGLASSSFEQVGLTWDLSSGDPAAPGSNYMMVNTVSVVPEPSTFALLGLGLAAVGFYARRRGTRN